MNELVFIKKNDAFTNSKVISEGTGVTHKKLKEVIRKHEGKMRDFGKLSAPYQTESTGGRPEEIYELNESQATFLITLLKNTEPVVDFKARLVHQFYQMRKLLAERQTTTWLETRQRGKLTRKEETDALKALVEYAEEQGSKNAKRYYMIYSKLANKTAGVTDRNTATVHELNMLELYENIILRIIRDGIESQTEYHQIYKDCESRLSEFKKVGFLAG